MADKTATSKPETNSPKPTSKGEAKPAPKKEAKEKKLTGDRKVLGIQNSRGRAMVAIGDNQFKVVYHLKNGEPMIGLPNKGSVMLEDWLAGKADLQP